MKEKDESWDGSYFREKMLAKRVIPFLSEPENVFVVREAVFVHDKAPHMRAKATQKLMKSNGIKFWGNDVWPGKSSDLNAAEHIGAIIKNEVEA